MYKKGFGILFILSIVCMLVACSSDDLETRVFELNEGGIVTTMKYFYKDDEVVKQTTKNVVPYESIGVTSKEEAKELFDPASAEMQGIDGVKEKIDYSDTEAVETLEIDYENVDFEKAKNMPGMELSGDFENGISMEESAKMLLDQGFTEK